VATRYGFLLRPRWIGFHLLVIAAIVLMINLGFWQLRRLDERQAFNDEVASRIDVPPAPLDDVLGADTDPVSVEWRTVEADGTYLPDEEFVVVNRSQGGAAGDLVVTPLALTDGRILLVQRGFVPLDAERAPAPTGTVDVVGRLRPSQERRRGQLSDPAEGELTEAQRVDIDRLAGQLPGPVVPMYVELTSSTPAEPGPFPTPVEAPELSEGPHLSYAVQWFVFSLCVAVGWVLAVRHSLTSRRTSS
jgi:cytochrome oxidase assembly protein ShyY1